MTSAPVRDPLADHLLTSENAAFLQWDSSTAAMVARTIGRTPQQFGVCDRGGWMQSSLGRQQADDD
jgi:hypothetical protein